MTRERLEKILPKKSGLDVCKCERAMLSWDKNHNSLVCHVCEKLFIERDKAIDDCLSALLKANLGVVPSVDAMIDIYNRHYEEAFNSGKIKIQMEELLLPVFKEIHELMLSGKG